MAITIKNISKMQDGRLRITVEDSTQVINEVEGTFKTYSFLMPANETPEGAKIRLEKAIAKEKKEVSDDEVLKQIYASELSKVDPSKVEI